MRKLIIGSMLCLCSLPAIAMSEEPDTVVSAEMLEEVTVNAVRTDRSATSSVPIHILSRETMLKSGVTDISDALHRIPGITLRDYGGAGGMKTVSARGLGAGHTAVIYDGLPVSDIQSGQVDVARYSLDNVGNLSMIIGDNDDIFISARAAASAATLSINSIKDAWEPLLTVQVKGGSFRYINPYVKAGLPLSDKVYISATGDYTYTKNDYPFTLYNIDLVTRERRNNSRMKGGHGELAMRWRTGSSGTLSVKAYYYNNHRQLPGPVIYYNDVNHETLKDENFFAHLTWRGRLADNLSLQAGGKFNWAFSHYHDEGGRFPGGEINQLYWQREAYATAALLWTPTVNWSVDYSADYVFNSFNSSLPTDVRPHRNSVLQSATAKFRTSRLTIIARLLGSLYYNSARRGSAANDCRRLSPSFSLSLKPIDTQDLYIRISYKDIFRVPTFSESYFDRLGSTDLLPEKTSQVNLGATYTFGGTPSWLNLVTVTADGYMNHISDMIVAVPFNMFKWSMTNLSKARIFGLDLTLRSEITLAQRHTLTINGSYSLQRAQPRTNRESNDWMKQVAYIPVHSGSCSAAYENPWVNISIHGTGAGPRYTTNSNIPSTKIDGYFETGIALWRDFRIGTSSDIELRFDLINMLDKQYCLVARYPMPGRSWMLTCKFNL